MKAAAFSCLCTLGLFAATQSANAAVITNVDRATFQASISGGTIQSENFDGFLDGDILGTVGGVTYGSTGGAAIVTDSFSTTTPPNALGSTAFGDFFSVFELATFIFDTPITAFAIDVSPLDGVPVIDGAYIADIDLTDQAESVFQVFPGGFEGQFIGFTSDTPFTNVSIGAFADNDFTLDTLAFGDAEELIRTSTDVPEPSSLLLISGGLIGLALAQRRRQRRSLRC